MTATPTTTTGRTTTTAIRPLRTAPPVRLESPARLAAENRSASADRGQLVIGHRVVEKIARQAASEIAAAGGTIGGFLGLGSRSDLSARPKAEVELSGRTASIDLTVAVAYPTPLRQAAEEVRQHVIDRVAELVGVEVTRVDVSITALHQPSSRLEGLR